MDDRGPCVDHLTKPEQSNTKHFDLEWVLPLELGLPTFVTLFDLRQSLPHAVAAGHGGDEAEALLDLWTTLRQHTPDDETLTFIASAYERRAGRKPDASGAS